MTAPSVTRRTYRAPRSDPLRDMTSPRVIELPRRMEPVGRDTFLDVVEVVPVDAAPPSNVVALRSRAVRPALRLPGGPSPRAAA